jgi:hypothetical protein
MRKRRKFADGGVTGGQVQQPTYPFYGNQPQAGGQNGGINQTFNMQPQASAGVPEQQYKKGGQVKVGKVMREFKAGKLKSSSGQKVTNPKQAIAIGLSEAGLSKKKGGDMAESKKMVGKEVAFMKKKGAPKSMIKHEEAEMKGMKDGDKVKKMAFGGMGRGFLGRTGAGSAAASSPGIAKMPMVPGTQRGSNMQKLKADMISKASQVASKPQMANAPMRNMGSAAAGMGRAVMGKKAGGLAAGHKQADGIAVKGKTKAMQVKMAKGGTMKKAYGGKC